MSQTRFLDKTLFSLAEVAERAIFSETYAAKRGLLQGLDVRAKLIGILYLIVLGSVIYSGPGLWVLYGMGLLLAALSGIPLGLFIKRVWLFVPLFSAAVVVPAMFNVVTPGEPLWVLMRLDQSHSWGPYVIPQDIAITRQGLWGAIIFVSRVAVSVSFAVLLTLTTRWSDVFSGLRALFAPRVFVMVLGMTYRYIFLFLRMIQDMYRARKSRTIAGLPPSRERGWVASRIGVTFRKSLEMSNDIYRAMLSRGYHGEPAAYTRSRARGRDYLWTAAVLVTGALLFGAEKGLFR